MKDLQLGLTTLLDVVANRRRHQDYARVCKLSSEYTEIFTMNEEAKKKWLRKYRKHEKDEMFEQAVLMYESTIPAVVNNLNSVFEKPLRSNRIYTTIDHTSNAARNEILDKMAAFWHGEYESGLDAYLATMWKHLNTYDPNAFIAVEFLDFDNTIETPQAFPVEYTSAEAIMYRHINGVLDYLIAEKETMYRTSPADPESLKKGSKFIMYLENDAITWTEIDPQLRLMPDGTPADPAVTVLVPFKGRKGNSIERAFVQQHFETKSERVPVFRVGYMGDPETKLRTCLSNLHHTLNFFKKEMKSGVELDLTLRAHVFPQKFMYGPKCEGDREQGLTCNRGVDQNGNKCGVCSGSGILPTHTTAQDVVVIPMPRQGQDAILDLRQAMAYFSPDIDLVKFMEQYVDRLTEKAKGAVFNSQAIARKTAATNQGNSSGDQGAGQKTATEMDYSWENVYDVLRPFTQKYSFCWLFSAFQIAIYIEQTQGLLLYHKFPKDYKLKPIGELYQEAAQAELSSLPQYIKDALYNDIANIYYADDQDTLVKIQVKRKFHPFGGKSAVEIAALLMAADILPYYKTLYNYFDTIFQEIEFELSDKFYTYDQKKQKEIIDSKVTKLQTEVDAQKAKQFTDAQTFLKTQKEEVKPA